MKPCRGLVGDGAAALVWKKGKSELHSRLTTEPQRRTSPVSAAALKAESVTVTGTGPETSFIETLKILREDWLRDGRGPDRRLESRWRE